MQYVDRHYNKLIRRVMGDYDKNVSVAEKNKNVDKFGFMTDLGTSLRVISDMGFDETYLPRADNLITDLGSTEAADVGVSVLVEGHYTDANGDLQFSIQTLVLNGLTVVALDPALSRCSRLRALAPVVGDIWVSQSAARTGGVPTDDTKAHNVIRGELGRNQSNKAATAFGYRDWGFVHGMLASIAKKTAAVVDFQLLIGDASPGGAMYPAFSEFTLSSAGQSTFYIPLHSTIIPANSDVYVQAVASTSNVQVEATFFTDIAIDRALINGR